MSATTARSVQESTLAPLATPGAHVVQLYRDDDVLVATLDRLVREALAAGDAVVTIATRAHHDAVTAGHCDREGARDDGRWVVLDAADTLEHIVVHGQLVARGFDDAVGAVLARAERAAPSGRVRAFGELVALFCLQGRYDLALTLEEFWSDLVGERGFSLLCAYPLACFDASHGVSRQLAVCGWHSHVIVEGRPDGRGQDEVVATDEAFAVTCRWCALSLFAASRIAEAEAAVILEHLHAAHPEWVAPTGGLTLGTVLREVTVHKRR
jgi:DcmR-like sensory protein